MAGLQVERKSRACPLRSAHARRYEGANTGFYAGSGGGGSSFIDRTFFLGTETFSNVGSPIVTVVYVAAPVTSSTKRIRRSRFTGLCEGANDYEVRHAEFSTLTS